MTGLLATVASALHAQVQITDPPPQHNFGKIPVGANYAAQYFSVFNNGSTAITLGRLNITNGLSTCMALGCATVSAADFVISEGSADGCSGKTLAPTEGCSTLVGFVPKAAGARTALLEVPVTGSTTVSRTLSGTGVSNPSDCVMDWAERSFPTLLTQGTSTFVAGPFIARCYQNGALCVGADAALPTVAPASVYLYMAGQLKRQGTLADLAAMATYAGTNRRCDQAE
jgi:hypothetical protein